IGYFPPVTKRGGGAILDPLARRTSIRDSGRVQFLETLQRKDAAEILIAMVERAPLGLAQADIIARTRWLRAELRATAMELAEANRIQVVAQEPLVLVGRELFEQARQKVAARVERFHTENPLLPGIPREDLRSSLGRRVRPETFRKALDDLLTQKKLEAQGEIVKRPRCSIS